MYREHIQERPNWQHTVQQQGLLYYIMDDKPYWGEGTCYRFSAAQIDELEAVTQRLHGMCLNAVDYVIRNDLFSKFEIPPHYIPQIKRSWQWKEPYLFGRFDFSYDGKNPPKLLEYNADTPTSLPEAAVIQWYWLTESIAAKTLPDQADQFNSIHESLVESWRQIARQVLIPKPLYFACEFGLEDEEITNTEDFQNVQYLRDTCEEAGFPTEIIDLKDIGWNGKHFTDLDENQIKAMFKLYPWEWIARDSFGEAITKNVTGMIEPPWKMLLSNKAILPVLWEMYPNDPNLLPAYFEERRLKDNYVIKPILSREGANITIVKNGRKTENTDGAYADESKIYQAFHPLPYFDGYYPVIGSWVASMHPEPATELTDFPQGGKACGMGIREDASLVTANASRFVPHYFL